MSPPGNLLTVFVFSVILAGGACSAACSSDRGAKGVELLNVSYDPTRELYADLNAAFVKAYGSKTGTSVTIKQSHGGSGKQARAVIDGLEADVVSLGLAGDIDAIAAKGLLDQGWQAKLPEHSTPYTSTIVFVVRRGNPKQVTDWGDLVKPGIQVICPNPKISGATRWAYLAAWGYAKAKLGSDEAAQGFLKALFANVPVLDFNVRAAATTFGERGIGDVMLDWENEAHLIISQSDAYQIVVPPRSILAEPPVAVVDRNTAKHGTADAAKAYLEFLYTEEAQQIIAKHHYRPRSKTVMAATKFPTLELFTIDDFGGWAAAQAKHFADGGTFDQIYAK